MPPIHVFDFDDTIAHTDARIRTKRGYLTTQAYACAQVPETCLRRDAFVEFAGWRQCRMTKARYFDAFVQVLRRKLPVLVLSSRAHGSSDLKRLVSMAVHTLGDPKLRLPRTLRALGVNHSSILKQYRSHPEASSRKVEVVLGFVLQFPSAWPLRIYDDDPRNLRCFRRGLRPLATSRNVLIYDSRNGRSLALRRTRRGSS
jgi:hypothetical protein